MVVRAPRRKTRKLISSECTFLCLAVMAAVSTEPALSQAGSCDPSIKATSVDSPYSYRQRTDRCEGIYAREVAGDTLMVASFTQRFDEFAPSASGHLHLSWTLPESAPVHLGALSLRPHLYYRMDSNRPTGTTTYDWPTDVLAGLNVSKADLGVVATVSLAVAGSTQDVYLPLRVGTASTPAGAATVQLVLVSDVELSEVYVSVEALGPDGRPARSIRKAEALGYGDYPAERGIPIKLTDVGTAGLYQLDIAATLVSGGSTNLRFWFYQSTS